MSKRKLKREISLLQAVGIFTGVILGSGILILPAIAANVAGASSLISWILMTLLAVPIALTFLNIHFQIYPIGRAMALIFWCYVGWEAITHLAEEFKNPERDFPLNILLTLGLVGTFYLLISFIVVGTHTYGSNIKGLTSLVQIAETSMEVPGKVFVSLVGFF